MKAAQLTPKDTEIKTNCEDENVLTEVTVKIQID